MRRTICVLLLGFGLAGCAQADRVKPIPSTEVPHSLLSSTLPQPQSSATTKPSISTPRAYFVKATNTLGPFPVTVTPGDPEQAVGTLLETLAAGPTQDQKKSGVRSALPLGSEFSLVSLSAGVATISVGADLASIKTEDLPFFAGQLVLTLTSIEQVDSVLFQQADGTQFAAVLPGGASKSSPVRKGDYSELLQEELVDPAKPSTVPAQPTTPSSVEPPATNVATPTAIVTTP